MRAIEVAEHGDASVLTPAERPVPEPPAGEVLIDVAAAGVNFADVVKRRGTYPDGPSPPYVPGIEVAGTVRETGAGADLTRGEDVAAYVDGGGYAELATAPASRTFPIPDGLSTREAAAVPIQWLTAHNALFEWGGLEPGERVLVHAGAGGVGSAAVQLAARVENVDVVATASTESKRAFARDRGADRALAYDELGAAEPDGPSQGVDLALDGVGGSAFDDALDALAPGGRIVAYGLASGEVPRVSTPRLLFGNHAVIGYHLGRAVDHEPDRVLGAYDDVATAIASGDASVEIDRTIPLERAEEAHRRLEERETCGTVLLIP